MTNKELLYVDDALGHLTHFETLCNDYSKRMKDPNLKSFVKSLGNQTCEMKSRLLNTLGGTK